MSVQLTLSNIHKSFGAEPLFSGLSLAMSSEERIGLIGVNGSGKSTLLRIMAGLVTPDSGERTIARQTRLAFLAQEDVLEPDRSVEEIVAAPLKEMGLPAEELYTRVGVTLGKAGFADRMQRAGSLSGGWRKRLALARELAKDPDILLLDEPTNHLDLSSILWLEDLLLSQRCGFVLISHDRSFLEKVTNRTIELGRFYPDGYFSVNAPYSRFLEKREEFRQGRAGYEQGLAAKVRREVEWLRRGPKARTTKAKGRIQEAERLQRELAEVKSRNAPAQSAGIDFLGTDRKTKRLLTAKGLAKAMGGQELFANLDLVLSPGLRLGLMGLNGSGKTTLLRVLAGELAPDAGNVTRAPDLKVVVFDQNREQLDPDQSLQQALAPAGDTVVYRERAIHVAAWAKRFLFRTEQLPLPVGRLSGGEQARILIARLMLRPADVLLLDEPTNNLDIQTLEVLEESLLDFPGAVVLISHDRFLVDTVCNVILGLGQGQAVFHADLDQWDEARRAGDREAARKQAAAAPVKPQAKARPKKLSYNEQREWDGLEEAIQQAEERLEACTRAMEDPAVVSDAQALAERLTEHEGASQEVDRLYARWEELEAKIAAFEEGS